MYRTNRTKQLLLNNQPAYGVLHTLAHPQVAEMIGLAGYDFVVIDGEHGPGGIQSHLACLQAVGTTPATAILRVDSNDTVALKRALDLGVEGVFIPNIGSKEEAISAVAACRYPPAGKRGYSAATARASDYGLRLDAYLAGGTEELLVCLIIESVSGVENAAEIAAVKGFDVLQIGPHDLTYDMGIPGQFDHPDFLEALDTIERAARNGGKILGGMPLAGMPVEAARERGYRFILAGADVPLFGQSLTARLSALKQS